MRTRSQPISPSGFQSLETEPRKRKTRAATAAATSKVEKPKAQPKKAGKRGAKTVQKKASTDKQSISPLTDNPTDGAKNPNAGPDTAPSTALEMATPLKCKRKISSTRQSTMFSTQSESARMAAPRQQLNSGRSSGSPTVPPREVSLSTVEDPKPSPPAPILDFPSRISRIPGQVRGSPLDPFSSFSSSASRVQGSENKGPKQRPYSPKAFGSLPLAGSSQQLSPTPMSRHSVRSQAYSRVPSVLGNPENIVSQRRHSAQGLLSADQHLHQEGSQLKPGRRVASFDSLEAFKARQIAMAQERPSSIERVRQIVGAGPARAKSSLSWTASKKEETRTPLFSTNTPYLETATGTSGKEAGSARHDAGSFSASGPHNFSFSSSIPYPSTPFQDNGQYNQSIGVSTGSSDISPVPVALVGRWREPRVTRPTAVAAYRGRRPAATDTPAIIPRVAPQRSRMVSVGTQTSPEPSCDTPRCKDCHAVLKCPNKYMTRHSYDHSHATNENSRLTENKAATRKRGRQEQTDDDGSPSLKRREINDTPVARHSRRNVVPYSERQRRRVTESQGRIDKTVFRIPQLIEQNKSEREITDEEKEEDPYGDTEPAWDVLNQMRADAELIEQERPQHIEEAPQTPTRSSRMQGLLDSVPRTISKLVPAFLKSPSPRRRESFAPTPRPLGDSQLAPVHISPNNEMRDEAQPQQETNSPHMEYTLYPTSIDRQEVVPVVPSDESTSLEITYSNGATGQYESQVLEAPRTEAQTGEEQTGEERAVDEGQTKEQGIARKTGAKSEKKKRRKRKRSPSPEVIPHPPGCSYGFFTKYFEYDLSEFEESEYETDSSEDDSDTQTGPSGIRQAVPKSILRTRKRVRFDASPTDTPSKLRLRNEQARTPDARLPWQPAESPEDTYIENSPFNTTPSYDRQQSHPSTTARAIAARVQTPAASPQQFSTPNSEQQSERSHSTRNPTSPSPPQIIRPNPHGTFRLDYDMFSDDSDEEEEVAEEVRSTQTTGSEGTAIRSEATPAPEPRDTVQNNQRAGTNDEEASQRHPQTPRIMDHYRRLYDTPSSSLSPPPPPIFSQPWTRPPPPRPTPAHATLPGTPADPETLARLRSEVEKYKPKLPSGLRAASRYSSSPMSVSDHDESRFGAQHQPEIDGSPVKNLGAKLRVQDDASEKENVPLSVEQSADPHQLRWPEVRDYAHTLSVEPGSSRLVEEMWTDEDASSSFDLFSRQYDRYRLEREA